MSFLYNLLGKRTYKVTKYYFLEKSFSTPNILIDYSVIVYLKRLESKTQRKVASITIYKKPPTIEHQVLSLVTSTKEGIFYKTASGDQLGFCEKDFKKELKEIPSTIYFTVDYK